MLHRRQRAVRPGYAADRSEHHEVTRDQHEPRPTVRTADSDGLIRADRTCATWATKGFEHEPRGQGPLLLCEEREKKRSKIAKFQARGGSPPASEKGIPKTGPRPHLCSMSVPVEPVGYFSPLVTSARSLVPAIRGSVRGASESGKNWRSESNSLFSFKYEGKNKAIVRIANVLILQRPKICNLVRRTRIR